MRIEDSLKRRPAVPCLLSLFQRRLRLGIKRFSQQIQSGNEPFHLRGKGLRLDPINSAQLCAEEFRAQKNGAQKESA